MIDIDSYLPITCLVVNDIHDALLWHRRIAHIHMDHLNKLIKKDLVVGLPNMKFVKDNYVVHVKWVNKQKPLSSQSIWFLRIDHCSYYTWTYLALQGQKVFVVITMLLL
ncbi:putative GAG-pre-integrase domain-containing protein [Lupinus albus]|uniref:Putative GAG-pre-integrase domain-containing protein n=1 Tax=Lupinus albus TaxID=3870 RepID=A0A6A4NCM4_LUPAL|nr:putative GAG-pre-integrase domain-containing protein [Lupinus albus]